VKKLFLLICSVVMALLLSGCWNGRALFMFEQPSWDAVDGGLRLRATLSLHALERGYLPRVRLVSAPAEPVSRLVTELSARHFSAAVVGPLLADEWRSFAPHFPRTRFLLVGGAIPDAEQPGNVTVLSFDRRDAFHTAGRAAAYALRGQFGDAAAGTLGKRIGVLAAEGGDLSAEEIDAFADGAAESLDGAEPVVKRMSASADRGAMVTTLKRMRLEGVEIILLGLGGLDPAGLETLKETGGSAVVADWVLSSASPRQVFLSVEVDIPRGIDRGLAAARSAARSVPCPVRIVAGLARAVPAAVRDRVEER
jgi:hypothetical protein